MRKSSTHRERRSTPQQRAEWVSRYRASGLTQRRFAEQHSLPLSTLQQWLYRQERRSSSKVAPTTFQEIRLAAVSAPAGWAIEFVTPAGLTIRCREALPVHELARLLRA